MSSSMSVYVLLLCMYACVYETSCIYIYITLMYIPIHLCINSIYSHHSYLSYILCHIYRRRVTNISFRRTNKLSHDTKRTSSNSNVIRHIRKSIAKVTGIHHYWDSEYNSTLPSLFITPPTTTTTTTTPTASLHEKSSASDTHADTGYYNSDQLRLIIMNMGDQTVAIEEPRDDDDDDSSSNSGIWLDVWSGYQLFSSIISRKFV